MSRTTLRFPRDSQRFQSLEHALAGILRRWGPIDFEQPAIGPDIDGDSLRKPEAHHHPHCACSTLVGVGEEGVTERELLGELRLGLDSLGARPEERDIELSDRSLTVPQ